MVRFLSPEWFDALEAARVSPAEAPGEDSWTIEQVVTAAPGGDVHYQITIGQGTVRIRPGCPAPAAVTFTSSYATAVAIARGELSTQAALLDGHVRVAGDLSGIALALRHLFGVDMVPPDLRAATTY